MSSLEREKCILERLSLKAKKALHVAEAALKHWLEYNPKVLCQTKDQELHDDWSKKKLILGRILMQLYECEDRIKELSAPTDQ